MRGDDGEDAGDGAGEDAGDGAGENAGAGASAGQDTCAGAGKDIGNFVDFICNTMHKQQRIVTHLQHVKLNNFLNRTITP